jgi:hypothetical protein
VDELRPNNGDRAGLWRGVLRRVSNLPRPPNMPHLRARGGLGLTTLTSEMSFGEDTRATPAPLRRRTRVPPYPTLRTFSACSPFLPLVGS